MNEKELREFLRRPLNLSESSILKGRTALAPMAGTTERVFREICFEFGAALCVTELASAKALRYQGEIGKTYRYLEISDKEPAVSVQLFGSEPEDFAAAIDLISRDSRMQNLFCIDINMGCPVTKVRKTGSGAALMGDVPRAAAIVAASVEAAARAAERTGRSDIPVTVKYRLGLHDGAINVGKFTEAMTAAGASMLAIHARTAKAGYQGEADWQKAAEARAYSDLPIFINGDIKDAASAIAALEAGNFDGIMIGRAANGAPWIFKELLEENYRPSRELIKDTMRRHLTGLIERIGEEHGVKEFRSSAAAYIKGMPGASALRREFTNLTDASDVLNIIGQL